MKKFNLYIDESGDFNDTRPNRPKPDELSMVGGILSGVDALTNAKLAKMFPYNVHCKDGYNKSYLQILETLVSEGARLIVFENTECLKVVNPNYTYMSIISEGLIKLFRDLSIEFPDGVYVNVVIAQRMLKLSEYRDRIKEKTLIAYGRENITGCKYDISIEDANHDRRLFLADIVCNTYLTRNRSYKFTPDEQLRIAKIYKPEYIYSVFEDATVAYINRLLLDNHLGEAICQISSLSHLKGLSGQRDTIIRRLAKATPAERKYYLEQMSLQLGLCTREQQYAEGIELGKNYMAYFLDQLQKQETAKKEADYWRFDTCFHILTIYDHLGNTQKCEEYLVGCRNNLGILENSWENMGYYFLFRLRELNTLMDLFRFEEVLQKAKEFEEIFEDTNQFFHEIGKKAGFSSDLRSSSLGKVEGIRLQAYINLLSRHPEYYPEALKASDKALAEFENNDDKIRQWCYRSLLMVEAKKPDDALQCMMEIAKVINPGANPFSVIIDYAYRKGKKADEYLLMYYTAVMAFLHECNHPKAKSMSKKLLDNELFKTDLKNPKKSGHPWNRVLWNIARYCRIRGITKSEAVFYRGAIAASQKNTECTTVVSYETAIAAEHLLHSADRAEADRKMFADQWKQSNNLLKAPSVPDSIKEWFGVDHPDVELQARSSWK